MSQLTNAPLVDKIIISFQQGFKKESFKKLKEYLVDYPKDDVARYNFAYICKELNYENLAIDNYNIVNKNNPSNWKSRSNLYSIFVKKNKYESALKLVNEVLQINKKFQPALRDKALILHYLNKSDQGLPLVVASLKQNPSDYIALNTLGLILLAMKQYEKAIKVFKEAITINPKYFPSYNNLGRCYTLTYDRETAVSYFNQAIKIKPDFIEAINNLANNYNETGYYKEAIKYYNQALKLNPNKAEIVYNIGVAYVYLNKFKLAEELYKKAYKINPNDNLLKKNFSILLLRLQRYKEAWRFIDSRLKINEFNSKNNIISNVKNKLWQGETLRKKDKILVIKEQGVGDEILYASMYPDLLQHYPNTEIETDPRLMSIFERSFQSKKTFVPHLKYSKYKQRLKRFHKIIFAASLGSIFRNDLSDFPKKNFLTADEKKCQDLKKKLDAISSKYKIGIAWRSRAMNFGSDKSIDLDLLSPILKLDQFTFINLQYGNTTDEVKSFYKKTKIKILTIDDVDLFDDFESQAALLKNLDLFITVSNSTAHVSGALGAKTWVLRPKNHVAFHYWNQPGNTSPWYSKSSIKLFPYKGEWAETIKDLKKELIKKFK